MGQWGIEKTFFGVKVQAHINTKTFDLISYSDKIDCVILMAGPDKKISYAILEKVKKRFLGQIYSKWCDWELWDKEEPAPTLSCEFPELKPEDVAGFHGRDYPSGDFKTFKPHEKFKTDGIVPKKSNNILTFKCSRCSNIYRRAGSLKTPSAQITCPECGGSMWLKGEPGKPVILEDGEKLVDRKPLKKPSAGLYPKKFHTEDRFKVVCTAISQYWKDGNNIPIEWIKEYNLLLNEVKDA